MTMEELMLLRQKADTFDATVGKQPPDVQVERREVAIQIAGHMVLRGCLPAWEAFDYAHGILQFLNSGTPFRFEKGTLEGVPAEQQTDFTKRVM